MDYDKVSPKQRSAVTSIIQSGFAALANVTEDDVQVMCFHEVKPSAALETSVKKTNVTRKRSHIVQRFLKVVPEKVVPTRTTVKVKIALPADKSSSEQLEVFKAAA